MEVSKALRKRRTIRKFLQDKISEKDLYELIDYARLCAYPANNQPLKFAIINDEKMLKRVFEFTKWAGCLADGTPKEHERPVAYIAVLGDKNIKKTFEVEAGAAITAIITGAYDKGIASCWLGAINREEIMKIFSIDEQSYELVYLVALGYPAQKSVACDMRDSVKYFEDNNGIINVPKRKIEAVIIKL